MTNTTPNYRLWVFVRSDLESLTIGKACAQVAHAASQCAEFTNYLPEYEAWASSPLMDTLGKDKAEDFNELALAGFGTTIVLDGGSFEDSEALDYIKNGDHDFLSFGIVRDPTYPLRDGKVVHYLDIETCFWIFDDANNPKVQQFVEEFSLFNGYDRYSDF